LRFSPPVVASPQWTHKPASKGWLLTAQLTSEQINTLRDIIGLKSAMENNKQQTCKGGKTEQIQLKIWPEIIPKKTLTK
jgi:hypothetical protein